MVCKRIKSLVIVVTCALSAPAAFALDRCEVLANQKSKAEFELGGLNVYVLDPEQARSVHSAKLQREIQAVQDVINDSSLNDGFNSMVYADEVEKLRVLNDRVVNFTRFFQSRVTNAQQRINMLEQRLAYVNDRLRSCL